MKCPYCGSAMGLEDEFCSFCGEQNPYAKKHQADMKRYKTEFSKTQQDVYAKTRRFTSLTVPLVILFVLFVLNIGAAIFAGSAWNIGTKMAKNKISHNASHHRENMERLIEEGDYPGTASYYHANSLYFVDEFDEYDAVVAAADSYYSIYRMIVDQSGPRKYNFEPEYLPSTIRSVTNNLDMLFNVERDHEYHAEISLTEEKLAVIHDIQSQTKAILITYAGLTFEEAEDIPNMSASRQKEVLERSLGK